MIKVALTKPNGEVSYISSSQIDDLYVNGDLYGDLLAIHIPLDSLNSNYIDLKYWDFISNSWVNRPAKLGAWYDWADNAWKFNKEAFSVEVRNIRNAYLFSSDWTQFSDSPLTTAKKAEWATYRQALRDIPESYSDADSLDAIIWPIQPEV